MVPECKPEWNKEATTVLSRLPCLMSADKPCHLLQPSLQMARFEFLLEDHMMVRRKERRYSSVIVLFFIQAIQCMYDVEK